jgi:hypothetical protein
MGVTFFLIDLRSDTILRGPHETHRRPRVENTCFRDCKVKVVHIRAFVGSLFLIIYWYRPNQYFRFRWISLSAYWALYLWFFAGVVHVKQTVTLVTECREMVQSYRINITKTADSCVLGLDDWSKLMSSPEYFYVHTKNFVFEISNGNQVFE